MTDLPSAPPPAKSKTTSAKDEEITWIFAVAIAMILGFVAVGIYSWSEKSFRIFACAGLVALASAVAGSLMGLIFGLPKTVTSARALEGETRMIEARTEYQGNTNLEQISDWLTKILIGAGLVELGNIKDAFETFGSVLDDNKALGTSGWIIGPCLIIAYGVAGFLLAYLWSRIYMVLELRKTDVGNRSDA